MTKKTKEPIVPSCANCYYVHERKESPQGIMVGASVTAFYCRRFPPKFEGIIRVSHDGWCGEWHEKQQ